MSEFLIEDFVTIQVASELGKGTRETEAALGYFPVDDN